MSRGRVDHLEENGYAVSFSIFLQKWLCSSGCDMNKKRTVKPPDAFPLLVWELNYQAAQWEQLKQQACCNSP